MGDYAGVSLQNVASAGPMRPSRDCAAMKFDGKSALVTGASRGIGRAIAVEFARRGADVALLGRDVAALEETAGAVRGGASGRASRICSPATSPTRRRSTGAVAETVARFGRHGLRGRQRRAVDRCAAAAPQGRDPRSRCSTST